MDYALLLLAGCASEEAGPEFGCFGAGNTVGYLLLALLLALLLLLRVHRRETWARQQPRFAERPCPKSHEALGRAVFDSVRVGSMGHFRGLFLNGPEARRVLGEAAEVYMNARDLSALRRSMKGIARFLPEGVSFEGAFLVGKDSLALRIRTVSGRNATVIVGTVARVDDVLRMAYPAFADSNADDPGGRPRRSR